MDNETDSTEDSENSEMDPAAHYDEFGIGEWERLEANPVTQLEYENTIDVLETHLPATGRVLDAGGGPGRYSIWLAEHGYTVEHLDVSAEQVRLAREKAAEHGVSDRVTCQQGDIRDLPFDDAQFDAVCCLGGPLSHVVDSDERARVASELARVATADAPVFVSVIGRLTALRDGIRHTLDEHPGTLPEIARTGDYTQELLDEHGSEGWAECHFFRADELEALLESAGFEVEQLVGLEGVASVMEPELAEASEEAVEAVKEVVRLLREDRTVADLSAHILAVCRQ